MINSKSPIYCRFLTHFGFYFHLSIYTSNQSIAAAVVQCVSITYVHVLQAPSGYCTSAGTGFSGGRGLSLTDVLRNRAGVL